ncbi:MAG: diguanylate cyclase, partial [Actinomycetota bacterium]
DRLFRSLPTGVVVIDADGAVVTGNQRWCDLVGDAGDDCRLDALLARCHEADQVRALVEGAFRDGADADLSISLDGIGESRFAELHVRPLIEGGQRVGLLLTLDDTTERREYEQLLALRMRTDPLTGLLNRHAVEELISRSLSESGVVAVLYLDVDDFKSVNDTRGHAVGDEVLRAVATAAREALGPDDEVARIGGDEFLVVVRPGRDVATMVADLDARLRAALAPFELAETVGVTIGRADRQHDDDFDALIRRADVAMYARKSERRRTSGRDRRR